MNPICGRANSADRDTVVRCANLAKVQINFSRGNILVGSYLIERYQAYNSGLSVLSPLETTLNLRQAADFFSVKDQITLTEGGLIEFGVAKGRFESAFHPKGEMTYRLTPEAARGN